MFDIVQNFLDPDEIRTATIIANMVSAIIIGPWLAFAVTPDAGFRCRMAFLRMVHRIVLCMFSIALMYNAALIYSQQTTPPGSAVIVYVLMLVSVLCSAIRFSAAPAIPQGSTWAKPLIGVGRHRQ